MRATLPIEDACEMVLVCYYCKQASTGSVQGTEGWSIVNKSRTNYVNMVDCCIECQKRSK